MPRLDKFLIEIPPKGQETDHRLTQLASQTLLIKSGASDLLWQGSSNTGRQIWYARCNQETLALLGLHGCIIKKNVSADTRKKISARVKESVRSLFLSLDHIEINEVDCADLIQQFSDAINNR